MKLEWTKPDASGLTRCKNFPVCISAGIENSDGLVDQWFVIVGVKRPDYLVSASHSGAKKAVERIAKEAWDLGYECGGYDGQDAGSGGLFV